MTFPSAVYAERLRRAAEATAERHWDGLVITPGPDLEYLIGSRAQTFERLTALVIPADGRPAVVVPKLELAAIKASASGELAIATAAWADGDDPYRLVLDVLSGPRIGVADAMPALHLLAFTDRTGVVPALASEVLSELRMIKDDAEIEALRRAGAAIDRVHNRMGEWLRAGRTEAQVAADIEAAILAEGHTKAAFIIVGSGPNGADPHHEVSDRVIETGDVVVIDIGGPVDPGYNSDSTRTYSIGAPQTAVAQQYSVLQQAQDAAVAAVRPGVTAEFIDATARGVLAGAGLGEAFVHRTGHGIGISVHEEPYIVTGNDIELRPGMAFSIEPGIYFPGSWGARIEDIVVVTADGCERLNNTDRALHVL